MKCREHFVVHSKEHLCSLVQTDQWLTWAYYRERGDEDVWLFPCSKVQSGSINLNVVPDWRKPTVFCLGVCDFELEINRFLKQLRCLIDWKFNVVKMSIHPFSSAHAGLGCGAGSPSTEAQTSLFPTTSSSLSGSSCLSWGLRPVGDAQNTSSKSRPWDHPTQMPKPTQVAPTDVEE